MALGRRNDEKEAERDEALFDQAVQAKSTGQTFFQVEIDISRLSGAASTLGSSGNSIKHTGGKPDLLGQIEQAGWRLENVGYVFVETGATSTNRLLGSGQGTVTRGRIVGIYLFRAV